MLMRMARGRRKMARDGINQRMKPLIKLFEIF